MGLTKTEKELKNLDLWVVSATVCSSTYNVGSPTSNMSVRLDSYVSFKTELFKSPC